MLLLLVLSSVSVHFAVSQQPSFDYPDAMPEPLEAIGTYMSEAVKFIGEYEGPMQVRSVSAINQMGWNCIANYHLTALDSVTKERPVVKIDENIINTHGNRYTRMLCYAYALHVIMPSLVPDFVSGSDTILTRWELPKISIETYREIIQCGHNDSDCLTAVASNHCFTPDVIGATVSYQMTEFLKDDGYNADGSKTDYGCCTANCQPFSDYTGYKKENRRGRRRYRNRWRPLRESNGKGFFYEYEHVTPHIGKKAKTKVISRPQLEANNKRCPHPNYDFNEEAEEVIERMADLATNDTMKMVVEFFDNKIQMNMVLTTAIAQRLQWTFEERQLYALGASTVEYDAVIQAWLAKRTFDLIRPTSFIKRWKKRRISTWGGPFGGLKRIYAADFEAYFRVMPHSEYPSGSTCICLGVTDFAREYLRKRHSINQALHITVPTFIKGSSLIEPGATPAEDINVDFDTLKEYSDTCAESRLWGGMHFTKSLAGSREICRDIGAMGYDYIVHLLDGHPL